MNYYLFGTSQNDSETEGQIVASVIKTNATSVWAKMTQVLSKIFLLLRRIPRDVVRSVHRPWREVPLSLSDINETRIFYTDFLQKYTKI